MSFFFTKIALRELGPFTLVFYRLSIAAFVSFLILSLAGRKLPTSLVSWRQFFMLGAFNSCIPFTLVSIGQVYIDSSLASILNATTPVFTVIMAHLLLDNEKLDGHRISGVLLGLAGVLILIGPQSLLGVTSDFVGHLALLGTAMCYAYGSIYAKSLDEMPMLEAMTGTLVAACILSCPLVMLLEFPLVTNIQLSTISAVLFISVLATCFTYLLFFYIVRTAGSTNTVLVVFLIPITAVLMGVFVLGEQFDSQTLLGMLVIFSGLIFVDGRLSKRVFSRA